MKNKRQVKRIWVILFGVLGLCSGANVGLAAESILIADTLGSLELVPANNYSLILQMIEKNSVVLGALKQQMEAEKMGNKTGIYPNNPSFEFGYFWGDPNTKDRMDFGVVQEFDFPSVYAHQKKTADLKDVSAEWKYKSERSSLLLKAQQLCIEVLYYNALCDLYQARLKQAESLFQNYQQQLDKGQGNIIERNKAQMNMLSVQSEWSRMDMERANRLAELQGLNGGDRVVLIQKEFPELLLPSNFEQWYGQAADKNPILKYVESQVLISEEKVKLSAAKSWPTFSAGYKGENVFNREGYNGIMIGLSIPLWENKNTIKQAKMERIVAEKFQQDKKMQFYSRLQALFAKAQQLQQIVFAYKKSLADWDNLIFLKKALDAGEISLLVYLQEMEYHFSTMNQYLEAERDLALAWSELNNFSL
ncbi:MAG: TolC family protein [Bacteroidales bacterium]